MRSPLKVLRRTQAWAARAPKRWIRPHGLILAYHRVARRSLDPWELIVTPENFRAHVEVLRRHVEVVALESLVGSLRRRRDGRPAVAITFDDGYLDNLEHAEPILRPSGLPATVFVTTGWIGRGTPFWWDRLTWILLGGPRVPDHLSIELGNETFEWDAPSSDQDSNGPSSRRLNLHREIWRRLRLQDDTTREAALDALAAWSGSDGDVSEAGQPMTADEVRLLAGSGRISVGGHTVSHTPLPELTVDRQRTEISLSLDDCEDLVGYRPTTFAYPHGLATRETRAAAREAGISAACSGRHDLAWEGVDPLDLPRMSVLDWSGPVFERWLLRYWLP